MAATQVASENHAGTIAVTPRSLSKEGHPALTALTRAGYELVFPAPGAIPNQEQLLSTLPSCVGYLAGTEPLPGTMLELFPNLRAISRNGVGVDSIDMAAAERLGIHVLTAPGANSQGVAELAIGLILGSQRNIPWHDAQLKSHQWNRRAGREVAGQVLGLVGCGQIGRRVATMAIGLGMKVLAFDEYPLETFNPSPDFSWQTLNEVLAESDVISLHVPPSDQPLLGANNIALLKDGVVIVNTARATLVDEPALLASLETGHVSFYATDVFTTEPPPPSALIGHPHVIATPHIGGYTRESVDRATQAAVQNLLQALEQQP